VRCAYLILPLKVMPTFSRARGLEGKSVH
jgi:hypothetical protein